MDQTAKLLSRVAENARAGLDATDRLLLRAQDGDMMRELERELGDYRAAALGAEERLSKIGEKSGTTRPCGGAKANAAADRPGARLADLAIRGAVMGVIDTTDARNEFPDADADAQDAASRFITRQQEAIERMKGFLS